MSTSKKVIMIVGVVVVLLLVYMVLFGFIGGHTGRG